MVTWASVTLFIRHRVRLDGWGWGGGVTEAGRGDGLLSWRRACSAITDSHLLPGGMGLSVQDGTQASEAGIGRRLDPVGRGQAGLRRVHGADVVAGLVPSPPPQVSQVGEAQFLWLAREEQILVSQSRQCGPLMTPPPPFKANRKVVGLKPRPCHLKLEQCMNVSSDARGRRQWGREPS